MNESKIKAAAMAVAAILVTSFFVGLFGMTTESFGRFILSLQ